MKVGFNEENLEQLIDSCVLKSQDAVDKSLETQKRVNSLESNILKTIQKVGIVRYCAFEDRGGDQSFSIALLDALDNGIVLTGLFYTDSSAVYAKHIELGNSKYTLTAEEIQSIDRAKRNFGDIRNSKSN